MIRTPAGRAPSPVEGHGDVVAGYGLDSFPFPLVVTILFLIVLARAQGTYWLGRGIAAGTIRSGLGRGLAKRLTGPGLTRAVALLNRFGAPAVTLSFLTVGVQTMVNGAAGLTRMPWPRYTLAMVPGCIAWAFIYATIGLAAFYTAVGAAAGSPWAAAAAGALVALATSLAIRRRRRQPAPPTASTASTAPP